MLQIAQIQARSSFEERDEKRPLMSHMTFIRAAVVFSFLFDLCHLRNLRIQPAISSITLS